MSKKNSINILKDISPECFIKNHWGKKYLFLENAIEIENAVITKRTIGKLIRNPDIFSKLIIKQNNSSETFYGPFNELPKQKINSLLIYKFHHIQKFAHELSQSVNFIPYCLHDDVMVSFSSKDGGVGPHSDSYDVFLIQGGGSKKWSIGKTDKSRFQLGEKSHSNETFKAEYTIISNPGDILYIPPFTPHHGVALSDDCITYSVGFRSPSNDEIRTRYLEFLMDNVISKASIFEDLDIDTNLKSSIPLSLVSFIKNNTSLKNSNICIDDFIGIMLSEPDSDIFFKKQKKISDSFIMRFEEVTLYLNIKSRTISHNKLFFINGEKISISDNNHTFFIKFFDNKKITINPIELNLELKGLITYLLSEGYIDIHQPKFPL